MARKQTKTKLNAAYLAIIFDNMNTLLKSGVPINQCVGLMADDAQDRKLKAMLSDLDAKVQEKFYLFDAMEATEIFPDYALRMIHIGEVSGQLETVSESLRDYYIRQNQIRAQVKSSVLNPLILICIMAIVVAFLVTAVLPVFSGVYAQIGINMEGDSLVGLALTIGRVAMYAIFIVLALFMLGLLFSLTASGKKFFSSFFQTSAFTKNFAYKLSAAKFTSSFSMLISSGIDVSQALKLSSEVAANHRLQAKLGVCSEQLEKGEPLGQVLYDNEIFSASYSGMLISGIKAGETEKVMRRLAQMYDESSSAQLDRFLSVIEPSLIAALSLIIGIILACIMLPLVGIMSSIG